MDDNSRAILALLITSVTSVAMVWVQNRGRRRRKESGDAETDS